MTSSLEYGVGAKAKGFDGTNKYLRITDIDDETRHFKEDNLTSPDIDFQNSKNYLLKENDIVLARTGASVGKTYIYKPSDGVIYFAGFLIRARINEHYSAEFIFQKTLTPHFQNFVRITSQRSGQPGINAEEYSKYKFYVPKLEEQNKISRILYSLDILIALYQRRKILVEQLNKELINKLSSVYEEQEYTNLEEVVEVISGFGFKSSQFNKEGIPLIKISNIQDGYINFTDTYIDENYIYNNVVIKKHDFLIAMSGATTGKVGQYNNDNIAYCNQRVGIIRPKNPKITSDYLGFILTNAHFQHFISTQWGAGAQPNVSVDQIKNYSLKLPNVEMRAYIGYLYRNLKIVEFKNIELVKSIKNLKNLFLSKLFIK